MGGIFTGGEKVVFWGGGEKVRKATTCRVNYREKKGMKSKKKDLDQGRRKRGSSEREREGKNDEGKRGDGQGRGRRGVKGERGLPRHFLGNDKGTTNKSHGKYGRRNHP